LGQKFLQFLKKSFELSEISSDICGADMKKEKTSHEKQGKISVGKNSGVFFPGSYQ
jgi:hypothetical protein